MNEQEMSNSRMNQDGKLRTGAGTDELEAREDMSLSVPDSVEGLADYQEGDEFEFSGRGRKGAAGEDGKVQVAIVNLDIKPMAGEAKMFRRDQESSMPPKAIMGGGESV
jgi:hypothetical protein